MKIAGCNHQMHPQGVQKVLERPSWSERRISLRMPHTVCILYVYCMYVTYSKRYTAQNALKLGEYLLCM